MRKKVLIVVNDPGFFLSHRLPIAIAARDSGYAVHIATSHDDKKTKTIESFGFTHHKIPLSRSGINIVTEIKTVFSIFAIFKKIKPALVHLVTIKPVLYGGIIARVRSVPSVVSAISGLGFVYGNHNGFLTRMIKGFSQLIYKLALSHSNQHIIFQNQNDITLLNKGQAENITLIPGSGVKLSEYPIRPEPKDQIVVSMAARLLIDKGVLEFVEAAKILRNKGLGYKFQLIGSPDPHNPRTIKQDDITDWEEEGIIEYLGYRKDIAELFGASSMVVLPSYYREGLPKVLIEAAACGRAVITTNLPGCRDAVIPDTTGILIPHENALALASEIEHLAEDHQKRAAMGKAGRKMAEERFSIEDVVTKHLDIYEDLLSKAS